MSKIHEYQGEGIVVRYDVKRCIHAAECVHGLPEVFDPQKRPWIQPENAANDELAAVVLRCPTGALQYERTDGGQQEQTPEKNSILPAADGPVYVQGDVTISLPDGSTVHETRLALCRCGASTNKPFCDNSHLKIEFKADSGVADGQEETAVAAPTGPLTINSAPNGPLLLKGNFVISSADGQNVFSGERAALCRCGGSNNKPFCDGTHKSIGFEAE